MGFNILDLLLPRETKFYGYFNQLSDHILNSSIAFRDLAAQIETLSEDELKKRIFTINDYESKGDQTVMTIIEELSGCFITPFDRDDIHTLAIHMDRPLDTLKGLTRKMEMYKIRKMSTNVCQFADIVVSIATIQQKIIYDLSTKSKVRKKVENMHALENQADELFHSSMAELFNKDDKVLTVEMVKCKEVYELLESTVNSIDHIGKVVRGIKLKNG